MLKNLLRNLCLKIYISKSSSSLNTLDGLYREGNTEGYLQGMENLYAALVKLPQTNTTPDFDHIYTENNELLLKIADLLKDRNIAGLRGLSTELGQFLDKLYSSLSIEHYRPKTGKHFLPLCFLLFLIISLTLGYRPLKQRYYKEKELYDALTKEEIRKKQTVQDILLLKDALQSYYNDNKTYPKSSGAWDAVVAAFGESRKDWIPGLVPRYLKELPIDPRKSKDGQKQYMYKSDGNNFKLIAHNPVGFAEIALDHPELVDPVRQSWALGVWSEEAKNW
jgi:hypothetical protein